MTRKTDTSPLLNQLSLRTPPNNPSPTKNHLLPVSLQSSPNNRPPLPSPPPEQSPTGSSRRKPSAPPHFTKENHRRHDTIRHEPRVARICAALLRGTAARRLPPGVRWLRGDCVPHHGAAWEGGQTFSPIKPFWLVFFFWRGECSVFARSPRVEKDRRMGEDGTFTAFQDPEKGKLVLSEDVNCLTIATCKMFTIAKCILRW